MVDKIKNYLPKLFTKMRKAVNKIPAPIRWLGFLYAGFVAGVLCLYVGLFLYEFFGGKSASKDLLPFINILIGSSMISFISFVLGLCIDSDDDGVPDILDKEDGEKNEL